MANIKLGDNTLNNVDTIKVKDANDTSKYVSFAEKKSGTTIENTKTYSRIYLNPDVTYDEVKAVYDTLTKQTFMGVTGYLIWGGYESDNAAHIQLWVMMHNAFCIYETSDGFATIDNVSGDMLSYDSSVTWTQIMRGNATFDNVIRASEVVPNDAFSEPLQSLNGLPIGEENEKLKNIFSATAFI